MPPALTSLSHGAGCGCKLSAADLRPIVAALPRPADPRVLVAADTADAAGAHALTDVTGFGLLGHLHELASASGVAAEVEAAAVPAIDGALDLFATDDALAGGSKRNRADAETFTAWTDGVPEPRRRLLCDAMTSGGLLAAVPPGRVEEIEGAVIGRLTAGEAGTIAVG